GRRYVNGPLRGVRNRDGLAVEVDLAALVQLRERGRRADRRIEGGAGFRRSPVREQKIRLGQRQRRVGRQRDGDGVIDRERLCPQALGQLFQPRRYEQGLIRFGDRQRGLR